MVLLALAASLLIGSNPGTAQLTGGPGVVAQSNLLQAQILTDMSAATAAYSTMQMERAKREAQLIEEGNMKDHFQAKGERADRYIKETLDLHNYYSRKMYFMNIFYVQYESRGFTTTTSSGTTGRASGGGGPGPVQY